MSKELAASGQLSAETIKAVRKHWDNCSDVVALCDMALSSLRGTFADDGAASEIKAEGFAEGIAAAAKLADANGGLQIRWFASEIRALAQDQRESNSNPAPMHGQSKTGLTESHPGAPTKDADELLLECKARITELCTAFGFAFPYATFDRIDAHLSRKEQ